MSSSSIKLQRENQTCRISVPSPFFFPTWKSWAGATSIVRPYLCVTIEKSALPEMFRFEPQVTRLERKCLSITTSRVDIMRLLQPNYLVLRQLELKTDGMGRILTRLPQPHELPPPMVMFKSFCKTSNLLFTRKNQSFWAFQSFCHSKLKLAMLYGL